MIGWLIRRLVRLLARRLGWLALATAARSAVGRGVSVRSIRRGAAGAGRACRAANDGRRRFGRGARRALGAVERRPRPIRAGRQAAIRFGEEVAVEAEDTRRRLRSRMLRHLVDEEAADDALLDLCRAGPDPTGAALAPHTQLTPGGSSEPPDPVPPGRWRASPGLGDRPVPRVQRTYQRPNRPWDR